MTEPTDAELDSIDMEAQAVANQNSIGTLFAWRKAYLAAFARAVLAKWGTPPADASEKAGLDGVRAKAREIAQARFGLPKDDYWGEAELCIGALEDMLDWLMQHGWSAPQPTQAQAGAVPLTDEQARELVELESWGPDATTINAQLLRTIRRTEAAHGIKGGQHGPA